MRRQATRIRTIRRRKLITNIILAFIELWFIYSFPKLSIFIFILFLLYRYMIFLHNKKEAKVECYKKHKNIKFGINETSKSEFIDEDIYLGGLRK